MDPLPLSSRDPVAARLAAIKRINWPRVAQAAAVLERLGEEIPHRRLIRKLATWEKQRKRGERHMAASAKKLNGTVAVEDAADILIREEAAGIAEAQQRQAEKDQRQRRAYVERATHYVNEHAKLMDSVTAIRSVPSLRPLIEAFSVSNGRLGDEARSDVPPFVGRLEMWTSLVIQLRDDLAAQSGRLERAIAALENLATPREKVLEIMAQLDRGRQDEALEAVMGKIRTILDQRRLVAAEVEQVVGLFAPLVKWTEAE